MFSASWKCSYSRAAGRPTKPETFLIQAGNVLIPENGREPIRKAHRRAVARRYDAKLRNEFRGPKAPGQAAPNGLGHG